MGRLLLLVLLVPSFLAGGRGGDLVKAIREAGLDATECYRVRDVSFARDEAQVFLTDGYLIFGKAVGGRRMTAVFSADTEGGDAELLLLPPNHAERTALAKHTGSPNLEEHFSSAIFVFADNTEHEIMEQIGANPYIKKAPEMGVLLSEKWAPVVRNVETSFGLRLALDLLSPNVSRKGFFGAAFGGKHLGAFDLVYDARGREQMVAGQSEGNGFDIWTSFVSRSFRAKAFSPEFRSTDYRIDSTIDADLKMRCITHLKLQVAADHDGALPFEISKQMQITSASIDGEPVELLTNPAPRSSIESPYGNDMFVLVPPEPLTAGKTYEVELHDEGKVITDAGNHVYFVGSRGSWFPSRDLQFSNFDLTFRYPKDLDLVASGDLVEERVEGDTRISHRITPSPIRLAGFNLGVYDRITVKRPGLTIEICANKSLERALQPRPVADPTLITSPLGIRRPNRDSGVIAPAPVTAPSPSDRLQALAQDLGDAMDFFTARFGASSVKTLEVAPVPGRFGQGFPGLIYLSTFTYVQPASMDARQNVFFTELLDAHEAAHQWWGNVVTSAGYHDDWVMESLANYSALLYLEKKKGPKTLDAILQGYRTELLARPLPHSEQKTAETSETVESSGPVVQGTRVDGNWNTVVYGKGSWIIHMLRKKMGDDAFLKMLAALRKEFDDKTISTEEFRNFAATFLPPKSSDPKLEAFFDQWIYGTGVPELKIDYKISGKAPVWRVTGTVTQKGVSDDFVSEVPIEIQLGKLKPQTLIVRASNEPTPFSTTVKTLPTKVSIDSKSILSR
jgi:Peptidase family M1 domain